MALRRLIVLLTTTVALALAVACSASSGEPAAPTPTSEGTPTIRAENEQGAAPVFWRTTDSFDALLAGVGAKVVFRITNGYTEETLRIVAQPAMVVSSVEFEASRATPGDTELPGAYYALNLDLPDTGVWQITVLAGEDQVIIPATVVPAEG